MVVDVRWLNGDPARGVRVHLVGDAKVPLAREGFYRDSGWRKWTRTDEDGAARFDGVPAGKIVAFVNEQGFVGAEASRFDLLPAGEARVLLGEAPGRGVAVQVLDGRGEPVPGAVLHVAGEEEGYAPVDGDDVQQLGLVTGAGGWAFLPRVPPGPLRMRAALGTRSREFTVEGERARVVLPDG